MRLPLPIILIIIPVVLLVIFGKNPIKEAELQMQKYGNDPLVAAVTIHNEQEAQRNRFSFGEWGLKSAPVSTPQHIVPQAGNVVDEALSVGISPTQPPVHTAQESNKNYYPPLIGNNKTHSVPRVTGDARLRSGQRIEFEDMRVFTIDASGKRIPLPDGEYTLYDGSHITVQDGVRTSSH